MNTILSENLHLKSNEFYDFHHEISRKALEILNSSSDYFEQKFDTEFAKKITSDTRLLIRNKINQNKIDFEKQNKRNTTEGVTLAIYLGQKFITTAIYQNELQIISDKFDQKLRPNLITIENGILFGSEAKNYLESSHSEVKNNFDIKQLLGKDRKSLTHEELDCFPFNFVEDKLSVYMTYDDLMIDMSIETILALLILSLKAEAEEQIGDIVSNLVLTCPTNYNLIKKNAIINATKIAGIDDHSYIIREISAAAIGYTKDKREIMNIDSKYITFIILNEYECDVAV